MAQLNCEEMPNPALPAGFLVDERFEVLSFIARGPLSTVYKVRNVLSEQIAALKILDHQLCSETAVQRFEREAKILSALDHPSIVKLYACGHCPRTGSYLVMEFVDGNTLGHLISEKKVLPEEMVRYVLDVCAGMQHAHEMGFVHRDLKPANILITNDSRAKIADFGIASLLEQNNTNVRLTVTAVVVGSPAFMSPEQCIGGKVDARSDVYSIGCIMFAALAGKTPFQDETIFGVMAAHAQAEIASIPSLYDVPARLTDAILKCLKKKPEDRFQSMNDLQSKLRSIDWNTLRWTRRKSSRRLSNNVLFVGLICTLVAISLVVASRLSAPVDPDFLRFGITRKEVEAQCESAEKRVEQYDKWFTKFGRERFPASAENAFYRAIDLSQTSRPYQEVHQARIDAIELIKRAIRQGNPPENHATALAHLYQAENNVPEACRTLFANAAKNRVEPDYWINLADLCLQMNDLRKAEECIHHCFDYPLISPHLSGLPSLCMARIRWRAGKHQEALALYERGCRELKAVQLTQALTPHQLMHRAQTECYFKKLPECISTCEELLKSDNSNEARFIGLQLTADSLSQLGRYQDSNDVVDRAFKLQDPPAPFLAAMIAIKVVNDTYLKKNVDVNCIKSAFGKLRQYDLSGRLLLIKAIADRVSTMPNGENTEKRILGLLPDLCRAEKIDVSALPDLLVVINYMRGQAMDSAALDLARRAHFASPPGTPERADCAQVVADIQSSLGHAQEAISCLEGELRKNESSAAAVKIRLLAALASLYVGLDETDLADHKIQEAFAELGRDKSAAMPTIYVQDIRIALHKKDKSRILHGLNELSQFEKTLFLDQLPTFAAQLATECESFKQYQLGLRFVDLGLHTCELSDRKDLRLEQKLRKCGISLSKLANLHEDGLRFKGQLRQY